MTDVEKKRRVSNLIIKRGLVDAAELLDADGDARLISEIYSIIRPIAVRRRDEQDERRKAERKAKRHARSTATQGPV